MHPLPDLWNLQCINTNIVQITPIQIHDHLRHCNPLQLSSLTRGLPFSPTNKQHQDSTSETTNTPSPTPAPYITHHVHLHSHHIRATFPLSLAPKGNTHNKPPRTIFPKQLPKKQTHIFTPLQRTNRTVSPNDGKPTEPNYTSHTNLAP